MNGLERKKVTYYFKPKNLTASPLSPPFFGLFAKNAGAKFSQCPQIFTHCNAAGFHGGDFSLTRAAAPLMMAPA
jgi:hypothetical protein